MAAPKITKIDNEDHGEKSLVNRATDTLVSSEEDGVFKSKVRQLLNIISSKSFKSSDLHDWMILEYGENFSIRDVARRLL